jgi:hypothetical protein
MEGEKMGTSNNHKVPKPGGAKALAAEYLKNQPTGAAWDGFSLTLSPRRLEHSKKIKSGARVKTGSRA